MDFSPFSFSNLVIALSVYKTISSLKIPKG